jgi:hypothetical protein
MTKTYTQTTKIFEKTIEHDGLEYTIYVKLVERDDHKTAYVYMTNYHDDYKLYWAKTQTFNKEYNGTKWAPYGLDYNEDEAIAKKMMALIEDDMEQTINAMDDAWVYEDANFVDEDIINQ